MNNYATLMVEHLVKLYEGKILLNDISFSLVNDEILCLLGPSGSGKSTLLRIVAGLEPYESGFISWNGLALEQVPPEKRNFGLMFQDYALFPHMNVFNNVAFGLRMKHLPEKEIQRRVTKILRQIHMQDFEHRKVFNLSGGEQQRIALARTLAPNPKLIMLDEPLGALDHVLREKLAIEIRRILRQSGIPTIYVTHDQEEAFLLADRILILDNGRIAQVGTPAELFRNPASKQVSQLLGLGNVVQGRVITTGPLLVETPLGRLTIASQSRPYKEGETMQILLRPEDFRLAPKGQGQFKASVVDCIFQGGNFRIDLKTNNHSLLIISNNSLEKGDEVEFNIEMDDPVILER